MTNALPGDRLLARAFLASLALHVMLVLLIPPLAASDGTQAVETISFQRLLRVAIERPIVRTAATVTAQAPAHAVLAHTPARTLRAIKLHHATRARPSAPPVAAAPVIAVVRSGDVAANVKSDAPAVAPTAPPAPEREAAPPARAAIGGMMPLGADEPAPVLDPAVQQALAALNVHVTLTVTVDADGHTKTVAFDPTLESGLEAKIRSMLASASWDPAVCGAGMACEASATIKL